MLQEIGLPISESAPPTQPSTVQIPSPAPSTFSDFAMSSRPASANIPSTPASSISGPPSRPTSKTDFRVPTRPDSSNSEAARPVSSMSYSKPSIPRSASISSAFSVAKHSAPPVYSSQIEKEVNQGKTCLKSQTDHDLSHKVNKSHSQNFLKVRIQSIPSFLSN